MDLRESGITNFTARYVSARKRLIIWESQDGHAFIGVRRDATEPHVGQRNERDRVPAQASEDASAAQHNPLAT
jgi:hypothetical protein